MKTKLTALSTLLLTLLFVGCVPPEDKSYIEKGLARLEVHNQKGSGAGSTTCRVSSVDGESVYSTDKYITVRPGKHKVSFSYYKMVDPGGGASVTLEIFGNTTELVKPRPEQGLMVLGDIDVDGFFQAGKTYWIDVSSVSFVPERSISPYIMSAGFGSYEMKGKPYIRERQ